MLTAFGMVSCAVNKFPVYVYLSTRQCDKTQNFTMSTSSQAPADVAAGAESAEKTTVEDAPTNAVSAAYKKKEPPPESPESIRLRTWVIASFWAIIIVVGLPIWWRTTTIYRASLPLDQMMGWADGRVGALVLHYTSLLILPGMSTGLSLADIHRSRFFARS
jgi:hypothetical protein